MSSVMPLDGAIQPQLSRELIKWLQSLDLAYSIRNVKRDFSNGFLIAEILSRYFDKDIQMHSYQNGTSLKIKKDNWDQLIKVFRRLGGPIEQLALKSEIDAIIHCEGTVVASYLKKLHRVLTNRELQEEVIEPTLVEGDVPSFAKPNATKVLRDALRHPEVLEVEDNQLQRKVAHTVIQEHESMLQEERSLDPERFSSPSRSHKIVKGFNRTVVKDEHSSINVTVKEVHVKQVDEKDLAVRRAAKILASEKPIEFASGGEKSVAKYNLPFTPTSAITALSNVWITVCPKKDGEDETPNEGIQDLSSRIAALAATKQPQQLNLIVNFFNNLATHYVHDTTAASLSSPKEYLTVGRFFLSLISVARGSLDVSSAILNCFSSWGEESRKQDENYSFSLFLHLLLPSIKEMLRGPIESKPSLLGSIYSFCPANPTSHMQVIRCLRESLTEINGFVAVLMNLVEFETDMDEPLLDLYLYYASLAVSTAIPSLRAKGVRCLEVLLSYDPALVANLFPGLLAISEHEEWWETHTAMISLSLAYIIQANQLEHDTSVLICTQIIRRVLSSSACTYRTKWLGLSLMSSNLSRIPTLRKDYWQTLLMLPSKHVGYLMDKRIPCPLISQHDDDILVGIDSLSDLWTSSIALASFEEYVRMTKPEALALQHLIVLQCLLDKSIVESAECKSLVDTIQDYLLVAVGDASITEEAATVLKTLMLSSSNPELGRGILESPSFQGSLQLIYTQASGHCKVSLTSLLKDIQRSPQLASTLGSVLTAFTKRFPAISKDNKLDLLA